MSKRKDIEYIHQVTGLSYGESRRLYKENGEDLIKALGLEETLKEITRCIPDIIDTLNNFCRSVSESVEIIVKSISEVINTVDWTKVLEEVNEDEN